MLDFTRPLLGLSLSSPPHTTLDRSYILSSWVVGKIESSFDLSILIFQPSHLFGELRAGEVGVNKPTNLVEELEVGDRLLPRLLQLRHLLQDLHLILLPPHALAAASFHPRRE